MCSSDLRKIKRTNDRTRCKRCGHSLAIQVLRACLKIYFRPRFQISENTSGNKFLNTLSDNFRSYLLCSQVWLPTVQDVLHADWQDVWHSPQPPFFTVFCNFLVFKVLMCFMLDSPFAFLCQISGSIPANPE